MTLHVRFATGFRWRPTRLSAAPSDLVRVLEDDGVHLALMANAYDDAFATCWPAGSRMILDLFVQAWRETTGPLRERLARAPCQRHRTSEHGQPVSSPISRGN